MREERYADSDEGDVDEALAEVGPQLVREAPGFELRMRGSKAEEWPHERDSPNGNEVDRREFEAPRKRLVACGHERLLLRPAA